MNMGQNHKLMAHRRSYLTEVSDCLSLSLSLSLSPAYTLLYLDDFSPLDEYQEYQGLD
jgi:hypothetical protein